MRPIRRSRRHISWRFLLVLLLAALGWLIESFRGPVPENSPATADFQAGEYRVARVVDGDTLLLEHRNLRARLQGIDTPETVKEDAPVEAWGPEASAYTERFVREAGGQVYLSIDGETIDRYGRQLVFVWHNGRLLNEELVAKGLARARLQYSYPAELKERLAEAEREAKLARRGIWSP